MKHTIFISDLHLNSNQPQLTKLFFQFITSADVITADALYILGDFFALWAGDDDYSDFNKQIKLALSKTAEKIPVYLMPGNRDFVLGKKFAAECNCTLLPDPYKIDLYGTPTILTHGDILCTKDYLQIIFRKLTQNKIFLKLFLLLPLKLRLKMADLTHHISGKTKKKKSDEIMDVDIDAINQMLLRYNCSQIIHGHTHKPHIYNFVFDDKPARRIVLGDWEDNTPHILIYFENSTTVTKHSF